VPILRASHFCAPEGEGGRTGAGGRLCLAASESDGSSVWAQLCVLAYFKSPRLATSFKDISFLQGAARLQTLLISLHLYCHHLRRPPLKLRRQRALCSAVTFSGEIIRTRIPHLLVVLALQPPRGASHQIIHRGRRQYKQGVVSPIRPTQNHGPPVNAAQPL
jgi:hypothetical protein